MNLPKSAQHFGGILEVALQKIRYSVRGRFSHANEQQILAKYIAKLLSPSWPRTVVDIGAGNGVRWSNSYALVMAGWQALGIEADPQKYALLANVYNKFSKARAVNALVDPDNIGSLLRNFGIERNFGVLSLDIDGNDFWVLDAILNNFRPGLVVSEINENIPPPLRFVVKFDPSFQLRHHFYGYSIAALEDLCQKHEYGILEVEYNNAFLAPLELAKELVQDAEIAYRKGYLERPDRNERFAANLDMEALHSMTLQAGALFVEEFYKSEAGKFYLATSKEEFLRSLSAAHSG